MTAMFSRKRHLSEERLFACYLAERGGEGIDPPAVEHLADCEACHTQYRDLTAFMDDMWTTADHEASDVFTPDALRSQQVEIARRLELVGHARRVLSFPHVESAGTSPRAGQPPGRTISRSAAAWIAGAAAAGLFVGIGAGVLYGTRAHGPAAAPAIMQVVERPAPAQGRIDAPQPLDDDAVFMSVLEAALERPRTQELLALDALTPHVRDVSYRIR